MHSNSVYYQLLILFVIEPYGKIIKMQLFLSILFWFKPGPLSGQIITCEPEVWETS